MNKLKDLCDYVNEKIRVSLLNRSNFIGVDNMLQNKGGIVESDYIQEYGYATKFQSGDILVGNIRPYLRKIWLADFDGGCSADVLCIRSKGKVSSKYIFACLCQDSFFDFVMKGSKGTKMPRGDKNRIMEYPLLESVQNKNEIGEFIFEINKKIRINNEINDNLQQLARLIYNRFFCKTNNNTCEFKELVNEITTGLNPRNHFKLTKKGYRYITVKNLTQFGNLNYQSCDYVDKTAAELIQQRAKVSNGDILFSSIAPLGRCYAVLDNPQNWVINESVFCIKPKKKEFQYYLYLFLTSDGFKKNAENSSSGSIFSGIRISTLSELKLYKPNQKELDSFNDKIEPLLNKMESNNKENYHLMSLRDFLLPLLMNGQATIAD